MTTYGAYDAGLPCKNPSCKSHGKPHPNCRCYGGLAKGGDVNFCSEDRVHEAGCKYFFDGGDTKEFQSDLSSPEAPAAESPDSDTAEPTPTWENTKPLPTEAASADEPEPTFENTVSKAEYETPGQQLLTGLEGAGQGYAGPVADIVESGLSALGVPGLSAKERNVRAIVNPGTHMAGEAAGLIGGLATGTGEAALAAKLAAKTTEFMKLGAAGSKILSGMMTSGMIQGGDEFSKVMLGQGDPNEAVSARLAHGAKNVLFSAGLGGALGTAAAGIDAAKLGTKLTSFAAGLAGGSSPEMAPAALNMLTGLKGISQRAYKAGSKVGALATGSVVGGAYGAYQGYKDEGLWGALKSGVTDAFIGGSLGTGLDKYAPSLIKVMTTVPPGMSSNIGSIAKDAIDHATQVNSGMAKINRGIDNVFGAGKFILMDPDKRGKAREKLSDFMDGGGLQPSIDQEIYNQNDAASPQQHALGGEVKKKELPPKTTSSISDSTNGMAQIYPEQHILLTAAKARIANYLNAARPVKDQPKLAFDDPPDNRVQTKSYHRALDMANDPLSILHHISNGTVEPEHVQHFKSMFPEMDNVLQKKLTEKIIKAQLADEKPPSHVREGLSLFLGTPLSGEMKPSNIQAAQAVFQAKVAQQQQQNQPSNGGKPAANTKASLSKVSQDMATTNQSLVHRQQRQN